MSLFNWPSSWVHPVYNIPSLVVKSTSSALWSSANLHSYSESSYLADQVWQIYPPPPQSNGNFTDSCSDSSYFFSYSESSYLADQVWLIYPSNVDYRFLLWELVFGKTGVLHRKPFTHEDNFLIYLLVWLRPNAAFAVLYHFLLVCIVVTWTALIP